MRLARVLGRAAAVAALTAVALAGTGSAQAATYDGQDPIVTGCNSSAVTVNSAPVYRADGTEVGTIQLRYSTSCGTVWARLVSPISHGLGYVVRNTDGAFEACGNTLTWSSSLSAYSCYSRMLNDRNVTSYAWGLVDSSAWWSQVARTGNF
ncbi:DUF2690 domain-containing protein [Streptomyces sp. NPDC052101]|uniref:DUF2690 domain-containing protein n=1 Tax=Streptomyces sp. NPDC052101 TaxID=3155763 RepID=UPI0034497D6A